MTFAENLPERKRKRYKNYAIGACLCGCVSEVIVDTSAIIILYMTCLQAQPSMTMFATSMTPIASLLLLIPFAGITDRIGVRMVTFLSCVVACISFFSIGAAPFVFNHSVSSILVVIGLFVYGVTRPLYTAAWYPLIDNFLIPDERAGFFGKMRCIYNLTNACLIFGVGQLMVRLHAPLWLLQITLCAAGLLQLGRYYFMSRMPVSPDTRKKEKFQFLVALKTSMKNFPLIGFSVYLCFMMVATSSVVPLSFIYMKESLRLPDSDVLLITAVMMLGSISGFGISGRMIRWIGAKGTILLIHSGFLLVTLSLLLTAVLTGHTAIMALYLAAFFVNGVLGGFWSVINSSEMLALARPGNRVMAMAVCQTFSFIGISVSRFSSTFVLGVGLLTPSWPLWSISMQSYQACLLFAVAAILFSAVLLLLVPAVNPDPDKA